MREGLIRACELNAPYVNRWPLAGARSFLRPCQLARQLEIGARSIGQRAPQRQITCHAYAAPGMPVSDSLGPCHVRSTRYLSEYRVQQPVELDETLSRCTALRVCKLLCLADVRFDLLITSPSSAIRVSGAETITVCCSYKESGVLPPRASIRFRVSSLLTSPGVPQESRLLSIAPFPTAQIPMQPYFDWARRRHQPRHTWPEPLTLLPGSAAARRATLPAGAAGARSARDAGLPTSARATLPLLNAGDGRTTPEHTLPSHVAAPLPREATYPLD